MWIYGSILVLFLLPPITFGQERRPGGKPVLVRDYEIDKQQNEEEEVREHNPEKAKKNVEVGDFYQKKGNLAAAEERFRIAIDYNVKWDEAYEKLVKVLEKQGKYEEAVEICDLFTETNPGSKAVKKFEKWRQEMERPN
jgi:tetratricopeptide (TPR) repeat protein